MNLVWQKNNCPCVLSLDSLSLEMIVASDSLVLGLDSSASLASFGWQPTLHLLPAFDSDVLFCGTQT